MDVLGTLRGIRIRTRDPRAQQPSDRTLLHLLSGHVQSLSIEANLRGRYWAVDETEIVINPNVADYPIAVDGFGKPLSVRAVYPNSTNFREDDVNFYELGDLNFERAYPSGFPVTDPLYGFPSADSRIAFYHKQGNVYARVPQGVVQAGTRYKIIYQVGKYGDTLPLEGKEIVLPEFIQLIEICTAISALPHCEWFNDEVRNTARRQELGLTLEADRARVYTLFKAYIGTQTAAMMPTYRIQDSIDD